jgi:hypothetical protein
MATYGFRVLCAKASLETSERQTPRQLLRQWKRCSALAFCARSRIGKVREIGSYALSFPLKSGGWYRSTAAEEQALTVGQEEGHR